MTPAVVRRCVVCTIPGPSHSQRWLEEAGVNFHHYDPGERRESDALPRDEVWTPQEREVFRQLHAA
jgi:hypothetical protein